jgi:hypothetical protein
MHLYPIDGAPGGLDKNDTTFGYRDANWLVVYGGIDLDPANGRTHHRVGQRVLEGVTPLLGRGTYVNFMLDEGQERVKATYRDDYERLATIKIENDLHNLFYVRT